jgi:tetratricopeptide (TPR) repeat protein
MVGMLEYSCRVGGSARPAYLLGCLLYDNQPERAIQAWENARAVDDRWAMIHRNLALGYAQHQKDVPKAIASLEKAVQLDPGEPRFLYELDRLYEAGGSPVAVRLAALRWHREVAAKRDDALTRELELLIAAGLSAPPLLDEAMETLTRRHFRNWEGSGHIHNVYVDACLTRGRVRLASQQPQEALRDFAAALEYPENLEVGRGRRAARAAEIRYLTGLARQRLGHDSQANAAFEEAASTGDGGTADERFHRALALRKLGQAEEAKPVFERLVKSGEEQLTSGLAADYFAKFGEKQNERVRQANAHYTAGLGWLGRGDPARAEAEFRQALDLHPAHLGAATQLQPQR